MAERFGYTTAGLHSAVADFRAGARDFFTDSRPGPKNAPGKDAARARIIELRAAGPLHRRDRRRCWPREGIALNRTGINEVIAEAGLPRIWRRPDAARGGPRREDLPRARALDRRRLHRPARRRAHPPGRAAADPARTCSPWTCPPWSPRPATPAPGTSPPISYLLSLLALKLTGTRRVSHVDDVAADPGAALFTGLTALPKTTALTTYSYRLQHAKQAAFLTALDKATIAVGPGHRRGASTSTSTPSCTGATTPRWRSTTCPHAPNAPAAC